MDTTSSLCSLLFADESQTAAFAARFARALEAHRGDIADNGFNVRLTGDLGAGKTTLTRALLRSLGVTGRVKSPTFELVADYDILDGLTLHHFDFYRFESPVEFEEAGFRDLFGAGNVTVCEWSSKAEGALPAADLEITLAVQSPEARKATIRAMSPAGCAVMTEACTCNTPGAI